MNYGPYTDMQREYVKYLEDASSYGGARIDTANARWAWFLYSDWNGGLINTIAQTRIASSYGLLQIMYSTSATDEGYSESVLPEYLNVNVVSFPMCIKRQKRLLRSALGRNGNSESGYNWSIGYDQAFLSLLYPQWNSTQGYTVEVLQNSQKYLPQP